MTLANVFGPMLSGADVEAATVATLTTWLPTYLAELERRTDRPAQSLPSPGSWAVVSDFKQGRTDQPPWGIVVSTGTVGEPERRGDFNYDVWWGLSIGLMVKDTTREASNELAKLYALAVRAIMLQKPPVVADTPCAVEWLGEANGAAPANYLPVGWVTESQFNVKTYGVVTAYGGPAAPDLDPPGVPEVASAHIAVERTT